MSGFLAWELQKAVFTALSGNAPLVADVTGIFDKVPAEQEQPYLVMGDSEEIQFSTKTEVIQEHRLTIEIVSDSGGRQEIKQLQSQIHDILNDTKPVLDSGTTICIMYADSSNFKDDAFKYNGAISFRAVTQE